MCDAINIKSTATIYYYLGKLEKKGIIRKQSSKKRALEILAPGNLPKGKSVNIPVVGKVAAGEPILAVENIEENLALPKDMFKFNEMFILNVEGESMINAGIFNGDKIIVKKQNTAKNGDIAVALIDGNATVKRFFKEDKIIRLQPENDFMPPIYAENPIVLGVVVGLLRKY